MLWFTVFHFFFFFVVLGGLYHQQPFVRWTWTMVSAASDGIKVSLLSYHQVYYLMWSWQMIKKKNLYQNSLFLYIN